MSYDLKTDDEIIADLGTKFDLLRRSKEVRDIDLVSKGGTNAVVLNKFRKAHGGISLKTFVRLLRGIGELDRLESLLEIPTHYSPTGKGEKIPPKRVRGKKNKKTSFQWGDEK